MSKKSFIDSVRVGSPCSQDWDKMTGSDRVRFCGHCIKEVNNLSELTRKEALRLVRASGGNICIRYINDPVTNRPFFADQLLKITRNRPRVAAGVITASLSLAAMSYAQDPQPTEKTNAPADPQITRVLDAAPDPDGKPASIKGDVLDPNGAAIQNANVSLSNSSGFQLFAVTDALGAYRFASVPAGTYALTVSSPGFGSTTGSVDVSAGSEVSRDVRLAIEQVGVSVDVTSSGGFRGFMTGVVAMVEYSSPLSRAIANEDPAEVRRLLREGFDPNQREKHYSQNTPMFVAVEHANMEILKMLLDQRASVETKNKFGQTPLMQLDTDSTPEMVELLIRYGGKLDSVDEDGNTPLMHAAGNSTAEVVKALINAGADINVVNSDRENALMAAAEAGEIEIVRSLIVAGSQVNLKNNDGKTAWDLTSDDDIKALLVSSGAEPSLKMEGKENSAVGRIPG